MLFFFIISMKSCWQKRPKKLKTSHPSFYQSDWNHKAAINYLRYMIINLLVLSKQPLQQTIFKGVVII